MDSTLPLSQMTEPFCLALAVTRMRYAVCRAPSVASRIFHENTGHASSRPMGSESMSTIKESMRLVVCAEIVEQSAKKLNISKALREVRVVDISYALAKRSGNA